MGGEIRKSCGPNRSLTICGVDVALLANMFRGIKEEFEWGLGAYGSADVTAQHHNAPIAFTQLEGGVHHAV